jgi:hypothetical protein
VKRSSRISLLLIAALAVSAFSAQSAFALWAQEGVPLEESPEVSLDGTWKSSVPAAHFGWQCNDVTGDMSLEAETENNSALISSMSFDECAGLEALAGLYVQVTPTNLPWPVEGGKEGVLHASPGTASILKIEHRSTEKGPVVKTVYCSMLLTLTPNNQEAISVLQGGSPISCEGAPSGASLKFDVSPAGQYGWE